MKKTGYVRLKDNLQGIVYLSYDELYEMGKNYLLSLRARQERGELQLFCGCCPDDELELSITSNGVIRVKNNGLQEKHASSCPKSEFYGGWVAENNKGVRAYEENTLLFKLRIPSAVKSKSSSLGTTSNSTGKETTAAPSIELLEFVRTLNAIAWERQIFSRKKEIRLAKKENRVPEKKYKSLSDFNRLIFGIANNVFVQNGQSVFPLIEMCYRADTFSQSMDYMQRWFIYAQVEKISPFKKERKYQYVTLNMHSFKGGYHTPIRMRTEIFNSIFTEEDIEDIANGDVRILSGYVCKNTFPNEDGTSAVWCTILKGALLRVSKNGLYIKNKLEGELFDELVRKDILFFRPYKALEDYFSMTPTAIIERWNDRHILLDVVSDNIYDDVLEIAENNEDYECHIFRETDYITDMDFRLFS